MLNTFSDFCYRGDEGVQTTTCGITNQSSNYICPSAQDSYGSFQAYRFPAKQMQFPSPMSQYNHQHQDVPNYGYHPSPEQVLIALLNEESSAPEVSSFVHQLGQVDGPVNYSNPSVEVGFRGLFDSSDLPLSPISMKSSVAAFEESPIIDDNTAMDHSLFSQPMYYPQEQPFPEVQQYVQPFSNNQVPTSNNDLYYQPQSNMLTQSQYQRQHHHQYQPQYQHQLQPSYQTQSQYYYQEQRQGQHQALPYTPTQEAVSIESRQGRKRVRRRTTPSQLQCAKCLKTFSRPYNLKSHQRTHTKERPFACRHPGCGKTFARPHDLKRHDFLHSGIKPHQCSCGKRFARSDAFKRHQAYDAVCGSQKTNKKTNNRRRS